VTGHVRPVLYPSPIRKGILYPDGPLEQLVGRSSFWALGSGRISPVAIAHIFFRPDGPFGMVSSSERQHVENGPGEVEVANEPDDRNERLLASGKSHP
jgi:hypothetical protein